VGWQRRAGIPISGHLLVGDLVATFLVDLIGA